MGYETSDYAFSDGVTLRYVLWGFDGISPAFEHYPVNPDNLWRLVKRCDLAFSKTGANERGFILQVIRQGLGPSANDIWNQYWPTGVTTVAPDNLNANGLPYGQHYAADNIVGVSSGATVGDGLILPPRAQIRANIDSATQFSVSGTLQIIEAPTLEQLKPFL